MKPEPNIGNEQIPISIRQTKKVETKKINFTLPLSLKLPSHLNDLLWMFDTLETHLNFHKARNGGLSGTMTLNKLTELFKNAERRTFDL